MTSPVIYVMEETPLCEIARVLLDHRISAVPVLGSSGRVTGLVSEADLITRDDTQADRRSWWLDVLDTNSKHGADIRNYLDAHGLRAKDVMTKDVVVVEMDEPIIKVAEILEAARIKRVPVMDGDQLVGIISRRNVLASLVSPKT